jgi:hypothetical protein
MPHICRSNNKPFYKQKYIPIIEYAGQWEWPKEFQKAVKHLRRFR